MKNKLTFLALAFSLVAFTMAAGATVDAEFDSSFDSIETVQWDHEDSENDDDGTTADEDQEWDHDDSEQEQEEDTSWDHEESEDEEETEEQEEETEGTTNDDSSWDHDDAENDDDGTTEEEAEDEEWDHEDSENDDSSWDHDDAENDDDGTTEEEEETEEEDEVEQEAEETQAAQPRTRSYTLPAEEQAEEYDLQLQTTPENVIAGQQFELRGEISNVNIPEDETATIHINNEERATANIDENGIFETDLTIEEPGEHEITVDALGEQTTHTIDVQQSREVQIGDIQTRQIVQSGQQFEICANIDSEEDVDVSLLRNGNTIDSTTGSEEICFETTAGSSGTYQYTIRAEVNGQEVDRSTTIQVRDAAAEPEPEDTGGSILTDNILVRTGSNIINAVISLFAGVFITFAILRREGLEFKGY